MLRVYLYNRLHCVDGEPLYKLVNYSIVLEMRSLIKYYPKTQLLWLNAKQIKIFVFQFKYIMNEIFKGFDTYTNNSPFVIFEIMNSEDGRRSPQAMLCSDSLVRRKMTLDWIFEKRNLLNMRRYSDFAKHPINSCVVVMKNLLFANIFIWNNGYNFRDFDQ